MRDLTPCRTSGKRGSHDTEQPDIHKRFESVGYRILETKGFDAVYSLRFLNPQLIGIRLTRSKLDWDFSSSLNRKWGRDLAVLAERR